MKQVLELNPLECPKCNSEMWNVAFLADSREINKIMSNLGVKGPEPPLKIPTNHDPFPEIIDPTYDDF